MQGTPEARGAMLADVGVTQELWRLRGSDAWRSMRRSECQELAD